MGKQDYAEAVDGIREGYEDFKAGRMQDSKKYSTNSARSMAFRVKQTARAKRDLDLILQRLLSRRGWRYRHAVGGATGGRN